MPSSLLPAIVFSVCVFLVASAGCAVFAETDVCAHCQPGFFLATNYSCSSCMAGCLQCTTAQTCLLCTQNYTLASGVCQPGPPHCLIIQNNTCTRCALGYQLQENSCTVCPNFCTQCEGATCLSCNYGFGSISNNSQCVLCGNNCAQCQDSGVSGQIECSVCMEGFYRSNSSCLACAEECEECGSEGCLGCIIGYYVSGAVCQGCPSGCFNCYAPDNCTACTEGFYFYSTAIPLQSVCLPCLPNCSICQDNATCQQCQQTYYSSSNSSCAPCDLYCLTCLGPSACTTCLSSYYPFQGQCHLCPEPCASCQNPTTCSSCASNQYYLQQGQCIGCGQLMEGCTNCSSGTLCLVCGEDYQLEEGRCVSEPLGVGWIVAIVLGSLLVVGAIGAGVYFMWKRRRGFMGAEGGGVGQSSQLRATYYEIP